jgi:hypothetical protein
MRFLYQNIKEIMNLRSQVLRLSVELFPVYAGNLVPSLQSENTQQKVPILYVLEAYAFQIKIYALSVISDTQRDGRKRLSAKTEVGSVTFTLLCYQSPKRQVMMAVQPGGVFGPLRALSAITLYHLRPIWLYGCNISSVLAWFRGHMPLWMLKRLL